MARKYYPIEDMYPCEELLDNDKDSLMLVSIRCPKLKKGVKSSVTAFRFAKNGEIPETSLSDQRKNWGHIAEGIPTYLLYENITYQCLCFVPTTVTPGDQVPQNVPEAIIEEDDSNAPR